MPQLQGLLFDLDGTLLDSAPDLRQAINLLLEKHNRRLLSLDEVKAMTGDGAVAFVEKAFAATGASITPDSFPFVQEFFQFYKTVEPDPTQIFPHAVDMLETYQKAGIKLGICTNKQTAATQRILGALNLAPYFGFIAGGDTFEVHKPNPGHLLGTIEQLGVEPSGCVFIGDGPNDSVAAKRAGLPCIVMTHGYCENVEELGADKLIESFALLPEALKQLGFSWPE